MFREFSESKEVNEVKGNLWKTVENKDIKISEEILKSKELKRIQNLRKRSLMHYQNKIDLRSFRASHFYFYFIITQPTTWTFVVHLF